MLRVSQGVTTLTPSYNDKEKVFRLLDSIKKSKYPSLESIVAVGGPNTEDTLLEGRKKYPWVKWLDSRAAVEVGQTGRYNLGFAHANPKHHILFVDSDVVVEPKMIKKLVERAKKSKKVGVVTPMILYLEDKDWVNQAGSEVDLLTGKVSIGWGRKKDFLTPRQVQGSGTVMLFTRELVNKIGCFEDWYLCYFDSEYCVRALKAGFRNWYEPEAICYHDQSKDEDVWRPRVMQRAWLLGKNRTLFMRKHGKNLLFYILFLVPLLGYYFIEAWRYKILSKWVELLQGTIAGFFHPVNKGLYIPFPDVPKS